MKKLCMSKLKYSNKNFSKNEIHKYNVEYGVNIRQEGDSLVFSGDSNTINKVKSIIKRDMFLRNNKIIEHKSQTNSLSSKLESINLHKDYSRINNKESNGGKNYNSSINFSI